MKTIIKFSIEVKLSFLPVLKKNFACISGSGKKKRVR